MHIKLHSVLDQIMSDIPPFHGSVPSDALKERFRIALRPIVPAIGGLSLINSLETRRPICRSQGKSVLRQVKQRHNDK